MSSHSISLPNAIQRVLRWLCGRGGYTYFLMDIHKEFTFEGKRYKIEGNKAVEIDELKAEAIKWVKFYLVGREDCLNIKMYEGADKCEHTAGFIINFFNLTKEDLK